MTSLLNLVALITTVGLVKTTPALSTEEDAVALSLRRYGHSCVVNNHVYKHGQVFTIGNTRCVKYICSDGSYDFFQEGCDKWNRCWPANRRFEYGCRTYMCLAREMNGFKAYEVRPVSAQMCQDASGRCWKPGDRFSFVMKGRLKTNCSCRPGGAHIQYYCYN